MAAAAIAVAAKLRDDPQASIICSGAGASGRYMNLCKNSSVLPNIKLVMSGGTNALFESVESAEDSAIQGAADLAKAGIDAHKIVIVMSASGTTPHGYGALEAARAAGAMTIAIANNPPRERDKRPHFQNLAEHSIVIGTGPEPIAGSTRMLAGSADMTATDILFAEIAIRAGLAASPAGRLHRFSRA